MCGKGEAAYGEPLVSGDDEALDQTGVMAGGSPGSCDCMLSLVASAAADQTVKLQVLSSD